MTKAQFYKSIVDLYIKTGQGLTSAVVKMDSNFRLKIDSLIKEGYIKEVSVAHSDVWYCLTDRYCVEEDPNPSAYSFIRYYLNHDDLGLGVKRDYIDKNKNLKAKYLKWLELHKTELEESFSKKPAEIEEKKEEFTDSEIEFIISRSWYKKSIKEAVPMINDVLSINNTKIVVISQLISLLKIQKEKSNNTIDNSTKIAEYEQEIKNITENSTLRHKIIRILSEHKETVAVNTIIKKKK